MATRKEKDALIGKISDLFTGSNAIILTEYRGLSVADMKSLRRELGDEVDYMVVKNTLAKIAARKSDLEFLEEDLDGPTAIAFVSGEPVNAAKALRDFAKNHEALVLKSGVMEGAALSVEAVKKLADLDSREVLLAKAAGAMKAKISQAAYAFQGLPSKTARVIQALQDKQEAA